MSIHRQLRGPLAAAFLLLAAAPVAAQQFLPFLEPTRQEEDLQYFQYDLQAFKPFEIDNFGNQAPAPTGWFFSYDRLYWNVSRPDNVRAGGGRGDFSWGNRFDIGYWTEADHGWFFEAIDMRGPHVPNSIDTFNAFQDEVLAANWVDTSSIEFNKIYRVRTENGIHIEPFFGIRYASILDHFDVNLITLNRDLSITRGATPGNVVGDSPKTWNHIVGPQVGLRTQWARGRWHISTEGRLMPAVNYQVFENFVTADLLGNVTTGNVTGRRFVPVGDLRANFDFHITRDMAARVGWELLYFGRGVARGNEPSQADQHMSLTGVTFGFTFNPW